MITKILWVGFLELWSSVLLVEPRRTHATQVIITFYSNKCREGSIVYSCAYHTLGSFTNLNSYYIFTLWVGKDACQQRVFKAKKKKKVVVRLYLQKVHFVHVHLQNYFKRQNYLNGVRTKTAVQMSLLELGHQLKKKKKTKWKVVRYS